MNFCMVVPLWSPFLNRLKTHFWGNILCSVCRKRAAGCFRLAVASDRATTRYAPTFEKL